MKRIIITSAIALAITGTASAVIQHTQSGAEDVPPIVTQVGDHEQRIGQLEQHQSATDNQVQQHENDIKTLQQTSSGASSASQSAAAGSGTSSGSSTSQSSPAASPAPTASTPTTETTVSVAPTHPHTITAVRFQVDERHGSLSCSYTLYNDGVRPKQVNYIYMIGSTCQAVGEVLSQP